MLQTVVAIERDGLDIRTLTLCFDIPSKDFDLITAVKNAAMDYCQTEIGKQVYEYNCSYFNWADFAMNVSNEFCEKYGFKMLDAVCEDVIVDWDEQLVDDVDDKEEDE